MEQKKRSRKWIIILVILLICAGVAVGFLYSVNQNRGKDRLARDEEALGGLLPGKSPFQ